MTSLAQPDRGAEVEPARPGRTELGLISVDDRVVAKLAAQAALEIGDAGAAAPRVFGRSVSGVGALGVRQTSLSELPKAHAEVDGSSGRIELSISVRWPASVPAVTAAVRAHVIERISEFTGLLVSEVRIEVTDLVTHLAPRPRVQ